MQDLRHQGPDPEHQLDGARRWRWAELSQHVENEHRRADGVSISFHHLRDTAKAEANLMNINYLEDFVIGQIFQSGSLRIEKERMVEFASEFDPQVFHLDEVAARDTIFGGLTASGWHTAAMTIRLILASYLNPAGGLVGAGVEELRWPQPVRPGDELHVECEILDTRPSKSRPERGMVKVRVTTYTQNKEAVLCFIGNLVVQRRQSGALLM